MFSLSKNQQAILYMIGAMFSLSAMNVALRMLAGELHSTQIVVLRHVCSIVIILLWATWLVRGTPNFHSKRLSGHFWRATFGIIAMELWFYAITIMPITLATALSFSTPIFSTILAILFLGEKARIRRWSAIGMGFLGMLIILRPDISGISNAGWVVIGASLMMAGTGVMVKSLTSSETPETIVFYMSVFMLLWSIPLAIPFWQSFTPAQFAIIIVIALLSTIGHLLMTRALSLTELVVLAPLDFTRLIFTTILAYFFFGETIDTQTLAGSVVIVASAVYIAHRESRKTKHPVEDTTSQEQ
jgi:drug/metabolite transporter (DMT)-like permease